MKKSRDQKRKERTYKGFPCQGRREKTRTRTCSRYEKERKQKRATCEDSDVADFCLKLEGRNKKVK